MTASHPIHPARQSPEELLKACVLRRGRTSGPGGQRRNKVETAVELTHTPTGIAAHADERRSAEENRRVALKRLRLKLATDVRVPVPLGDARSELWRARTVAGPAGARVACNPEHIDYPALLSEALDMIDACRADVAKAAVRLDVTASSLWKVVLEHAPAAALVNRWRQERGLHPLR